MYLTATRLTIDPNWLLASLNVPDLESPYLVLKSQRASTTVVKELLNVNKASTPLIRSPFILMTSHFFQHSSCISLFSQKRLTETFSCSGLGSENPTKFSVTDFASLSKYLRYSAIWSTMRESVASSSINGIRRMVTKVLEFSTNVNYFLLYFA